MHNAKLEASEYPFKWHFGSKTRFWELRLQGRFKTVPSGELFFGIEFSDYDYNMLPVISARLLARVGLPMLRHAVGSAIHFSWGDRFSNPDDPENLGFVCSAFSGFDQIIETGAGEAPPSLTSRLEGLGIRKNNMPAAEWKRHSAELAATISTDKIYTFCYWGASRFADILSWTLRGVLPRPVPLAWAVGDWPAHIVCYSLSAHEGDERHCESRKRYVFDAMVWSRLSENSAEIEANLASRYDDGLAVCSV